MDKLIEEYKKEVLKFDNGGYPIPAGLEQKITKEIESNDFRIHVNKVNEMLKKARSEGK